jgi:hypothetical protein
MKTVADRRHHPMDYFLTTIETPPTPTGRPALLEATTLYAELAKSGLLVDDEAYWQAERLVELASASRGWSSTKRSAVLSLSIAWPVRTADRQQ